MFEKRSVFSWCGIFLSLQRIRTKVCKNVSTVEPKNYFVLINVMDIKSQKSVYCWTKKFHFNQCRKSKNMVKKTIFRFLDFACCGKILPKRYVLHSFCRNQFSLNNIKIFWFIVSALKNILLRLLRFKDIISAFG